MDCGSVPRIAVRRAIPADVDSVAICVDRAYEIYLERMERPPAPMLDDYHALIARGVVAVATVGGVLAGVAVMWPESDHFYVDNIAVHPDYQRIGVAGALLDEAEGAAANAGVSEIRLHTNEAMIENLDFYAKRGFTETHRAVTDGYRRVSFTRSVPHGPSASR